MHINDLPLAQTLYSVLYELLLIQNGGIQTWKFGYLLHYRLINSCSVGANLLPPAVCINYAPLWIREDLLDRERLRVAGILLINDDHDNPLFY